MTSQSDLPIAGVTRVAVESPYVSLVDWSQQDGDRLFVHLEASTDERPMADSFAQVDIFAASGERIARIKLDVSCPDCIRIAPSATAVQVDATSTNELISWDVRLVGANLDFTDNEFSTWLEIGNRKAEVQMAIENLRGRVAKVRLTTQAHAVAEILATEKKQSGRLVIRLGNGAQGTGSVIFNNVP